MMKQLANAIIELSWSDLDEFSQFIASIEIDDETALNNERIISMCLIDWANEWIAGEE